MPTVTRAAIRPQKPIVSSGCVVQHGKESGTTGAL